jgi:CRISPR-associated endonuclease/helicase Cas3
VLDIALFHLALEATSPHRRASVRIVLVVDRRTVVDQAFERAQRIKAALASGAAGTLGAVRQRLMLLSEDEGEPVAVALLRGGIPRDDAWALSPAQPVLAVSTVDQVGSRLLFRGYGVSSSMRPIHAGLLGNDTLFVLDEVHLSEPFRQTLSLLARPYRGWAERPLPDRWRMVVMSATPSPNGNAAGTDTFVLDDEDRAHPVLSRRLVARKPVRIVEVKVTGSEGTREDKFAESLAEAAALPSDIPGTAVAVVVNRVRTAHLVFERVRREHGARAEVFLLTGRMRPLDRQEIEGAIRLRTMAGRTPRFAGDGRPTIVVTTQCIEAGADLDFDALVTECASLDSLRQRFGRLNRLGEAEHCQGLILVRSDALAEPDPIYGAALQHTWDFLKQCADTDSEIDFAGSALAIEPGQARALIPECEPAPILLPAHLDTWVQTSPAPEPDPDVALWLHGPGRTEPEVQVVWRADFDEAELREASQEAEPLELLLDRLEICPPRLPEALSVPLSAARRWLAGSDLDETADVEGTQGERDPDAAGGRPALAWRGERSAIVGPGSGPIFPGDTLVVPCGYGGLRHRNWAPAPSATDPDDPVRDLGDRAAQESRLRRVLRLHDAVWRGNLGPQATNLPLPPHPPTTSDDDMADDEEIIDEWLKAIDVPDLPGWLSEVIGALRGRRGRRVVRVQGEGGVAPDSALSYFALIERGGRDATTDHEISSFTGVEVSLKSHLAGVGDRAESFARRCALPNELVQAIAIAGRWHDVGKADSRFQVLLHGGDRFKADLAPEPLAKSAIPPADRGARLRARERSGYPRGCRHELMSASLILQDPAVLVIPEGVDLDLVVHLVASHHGWCRPLAPVASDSLPIDVEFDAGTSRLRASSDHGLERLDSGVSDRFFRLVRRYGWFGLAWLEAILRLADHRQSAWEQQRGAEEGR